MTILKRIELNELLLYSDGRLIYKRLLDTGKSQIININAYKEYSETSLKDIKYVDPAGYFQINAKLKLKSTEEGGRKSGFVNGYRPNHIFEYNEMGEFLQTFIGEIHLIDKIILEPGQEAVVAVNFLINQPIEKYINRGRIWWIYEGNKNIGEAIIL